MIENVAGAGGTTGITRAAQSQPDGYTIMMGHMGTHGAAPALYPNLKYDPAKDFAPIGVAAGTPIVIVAKKDFPANDLKGFLAYLKANGDKVNMAHAAWARSPIPRASSSTPWSRRSPPWLPIAARVRPSTT